MTPLMWPLLITPGLFAAAYLLRYRLAGWIVGFMFSRAERKQFYKDLRYVLDAENENDAKGSPR